MTTQHNLIRIISVLITQCSSSLGVFVLKMSYINGSDNVPLMKIAKDQRVDTLNALFEEGFGCKPDFFVKVPGRVNIIGEHIDYCGYPVLPLAVEQDIFIAAKTTKEYEIKLRNTGIKYDEYETKLCTADDIEIKPDKNGKPHWYNYVLCGVKGAMEFLNNKINSGLILYVDGNIPPASGLSSSSALVSASCLSFLYAQNAPLSKTVIASLCAKCERYIGTEGGGMDQAIAFLAEKYCAQYITFKPLKAKPVSLPEDAVFVVANSLAEANKAATNDFNRRVIECRLAAKVIAVSKGMSIDKTIVTLSEVQAMLNRSLEEMVVIADEILSKAVYTKKDVCELLHFSVSDIENIYLTSNTMHLTKFKLRQRALHVYNEAMRVENFRAICEEGTTNGNTKTNGSNGTASSNGDSKADNILGVLGNLMSESHESLKNLYECSHSNLDQLVNISKEMNVNSRLTGAGWGGCVVSLCPKQLVELYIETLIDKFYVQHCNLDKDTARQYVFATVPNHGAVIYM